ncbi:MAG: DUF1638 domain-containing protein [Candidatus Limnocylindrales bacterium]
MPRLPEPGSRRVLVIACGALARELVHIVRGGGLSHVDISCLPASLHQRPAGIPAAVQRRIARARGHYERIFVAYADCGTAGRLDTILEAEGIERLPGAHCYEVFAGSAAFAHLGDEEPGTFYLTDYLARHFERLVISGLGLDRHPELLPLYFGNYRRLVYLSQAEDADLVAAARTAAERLGLAFRHEHTGYGEFAAAMSAVAAAAAPAAA